MKIGRGVVIAVAAGVAVVIVVVIVVAALAPTQQQQQQAVKELSIMLDNVLVKSMDERSAVLEVSFTIVNPTSNTLVLEVINYTLYANNIEVAESSIGEKLEGIVTGSGKTQYLLPKTPLILKDTIQVNRSRALDSIWAQLDSSSIRWSVDGRYSVTGWQESEFKASM